MEVSIMLFFFPPVNNPYAANAASSSFGQGKLLCSHCGSKDFSNPKLINFVDYSLSDAGPKPEFPQQLISIPQSQLALLPSSSTPSPPVSVAQTSPLSPTQTPFTGSFSGNCDWKG
ncbi:uncharacterized protein LOC121811549 [Salvia splendens]|uniref:uncharacterized protein LOC121811549 n=1 Tax=Salvia splendens TaxID=180675 RepID=UPI001C263B70|nr:uncharacterized protein LOC121811549 [Salvia splendens]